jgi:Bacterial extracellular solute-binding protein, family 7
LIDNDALAEAVATSDTAAQMLEGISSAGVVGLTLWPEDMRHPFAINPQPPFLSPEDFTGMDIRTTTSGISAALVKALGANPVGSESTTYQGAESGLRQGGSLSGTQTATGNVIFFSKYLVLFANSATFEMLSDEQKSILREAAVATQTKAIAEHPREIDAATAYCAEGGTVVLASDEQIAAFEKAAQPVFDQIEQDPANAGYIAAIRDLKASTTPSAGAAACEPVTVQISSTSSTDSEVWSKGLPPNGIWQVELTAEDLEAVGLPQSSAADWASKQTLTLLDGEGTWFFQKPEANLYCKSTYAVVDDVVRFNYTADCSAEIHDMQWRLEDDGLHLHLGATQRAPDAEFKASFAAKPWQKIGEPIPNTTVWDKGLPPNGTWQAEATPEDFLTMGFVPSYAALLGGVYTWTFQDGKATFHSENQDSVDCTANYAVVGDVVRFNFTGGACAQDIADMQWRLDDDGLHMHIVDHLYNFRPDDLNSVSVYLDFGGIFGANTFKKIE